MRTMQVIECRKIPVVTVRPLWVKQWEMWVLEVEHCPYCGCKHRHGGGEDWRAEIGTKRDSGCGGSYILTDEEMPLIVVAVSKPTYPIQETQRVTLFEDGKLVTRYMLVKQ